MNLALPATRIFAYFCGGSVACVIFMAFTGEAVFGPEPHPWIRTIFLAIFFALMLVWLYSMIALMVRVVVDGNIAFWKRMSAASHSSATGETVTRLAGPARKAGDVIILAMWTIATVGLAIAVPAMIILQSP